MQAMMNDAHTRKVLLLLGAFAIVFNLAIALHESGHVIAYLFDSGQLGEFVLNPFSWSWAEGYNLNHRVFDLWSGVTIGLFLALIPLFLTPLFQSTLYVAFAKLLAAAGFLINGLYLWAGALLAFGDGGMLVQLGENVVLIVVVGIAYMVLSLHFWADLQGHLGLGRDTPLFERISIIFFGIAPYMILIVIYNLIHNSDQIGMWAGLAVFGSVITIPIALAGDLRAKLLNEKYATIDDSEALPALIAGLCVVLAEFFIFGTPPNPF